MSSTLTPAADFFAPPLDLDAGATIRLTRRPDDAGYEPMTFSAGPASGPPIPEPPAKPDEPTLVSVQRRGPLYAQPATRPVTRAKAAKVMRAASVRRASMRPR